MESLVDKYDKIKKKLKSIKIKEYEQYDISQILAIQIWKSITKKKSTLLLRCIDLIINSKVEVVSNSNIKSNFLAVKYIDTTEVRVDNEKIYNNAKKIIEPCNEIIIKRVSKLNPYLVMKKIKITLNAYKKMRCINGFIDRLFLASSLSLIIDVENLVKEYLDVSNIKVVMVFQDHEIVENILVQIIKNSGGKSVLLQHGQRVYRRSDADYMGIENFISDYTLLWNEFSREQFLKAGHDINRLPVVGSTKYLFDKNNESNKFISNIRTIGVVLDVPHQQGAKEANRSLIKMGKKISEEFGVKLLVKPHPSDKLKDLVKENININFFEEKKSIQDFIKRVDLVIGHSSGALVDSIIAKKIVLQFENETAFPLELSSKFCFKNYSELKNIYFYLVENFNENYSELLNIRKKFYTENSEYLHCRFFESLMKGTKEFYGN